MRNGKLNQKEKAAAYDELKLRIGMLECFIYKRSQASRKLVETVEDCYRDKWVIRAEVVESKCYDCLLDLTMDKTHCGVMDVGELKRRAEATTDVYVRGAMLRMAHHAMEYVHELWDAEKAQVARG